jgi:hypothetical protein
MAAITSLRVVVARAGRDFLAVSSAPSDGVRDPPGEADAGCAVTALYPAHALSLVRLAYVMLGHRASAENVVQEAFTASADAGTGCRTLGLSVAEDGDVEGGQRS